VNVFAGPAGGPKWFVCVGLDKAFIRTRFLQRPGRWVLLAGSSAGAWRCLAMACKDPLDAYEKLRIAYSRNVFTATDTQATLSDALRGNVEAFISEEDVPFLLEHEFLDLAVHTVRAKGLAAAESRKAQGVALLLSSCLNAVSRRAMDLFYERVVFFSGPATPDFVDGSFKGRGVRLTEDNVRRAALATGSLPYIIAGVRDIPGAPGGVYRDGGLADYQLNQDYSPGPDGVTLFFHYQERIVPGWLDKALVWRKPPKGALDRVLQLYPGADFVKMLPDARLPDRRDFVNLVDDPSERIRRWDEVAETSRVLGEQFMEDVESGGIRNLVRPLYSK